MFRPHFAGVSAIGSVGEAGRRAVDRLLWLGFASAGRIGTSFRPRGIATDALAVSCINGRGVGLLFWARADEVAKRRRQGLVVCRAASPFRGFFDARPGVTLAPTFTAWAACQSRTVRA